MVAYIKPQQRLNILIRKLSQINVKIRKDLSYIKMGQSIIRILASLVTMSVIVSRSTLPS